MVGLTLVGKRQKPTSSNPSPLTSAAQISISASLNHRERESRQTQWKDCYSSIILFPKLPKLPASWNRFEMLSGEMKLVYLGSLWDKGGRFKSDTDTIFVSLPHILLHLARETHKYAQIHRLRASVCHCVLCEIIMEYHLKQNHWFGFNCN